MPKSLICTVGYNFQLIYESKKKRLMIFQVAKRRKKWLDPKLSAVGILSSIAPQLLLSHFIQFQSKEGFSIYILTSFFGDYFKKAGPFNSRKCFLLLPVKRSSLLLTSPIDLVKMFYRKHNIHGCTAPVP